MEKPICWNKGSDAKNIAVSTKAVDWESDKSVVGVDCGKNTWINLHKLYKDKGGLKIAGSRT